MIQSTVKKKKYWGAAAPIEFGSFYEPIDECLTDADVVGQGGQAREAGK